MIKFFVNVFVDVIFAYLATLLGSMIYYTIENSATSYEGHLFLQFIIALIAIRFYRAVTFVIRYGQSK